MSNYEDIINLQRPVSKRTKMDRLSRAAQFAPFAALTGYGEAINETGRVVEEKIALSPNEKESLNEKLKYVESNIDRGIGICAVFFVKDEKKSGGSYKKTSGIVKKIDRENKTIVFKNGVEIFIEDLLSLSSKELDSLEFFQG